MAHERGRQPAVRELPPAPRDARRRSRSSCGPRRGRSGPAAGCSSGSGPSPSPRWPSPTSTCARPTTRTSGARAGSPRPPATGAAIFAITVASALLVQFGERRFRRNETLDWQVAGWTAVLGGLLVVGLQIWQLTELPFFPGSSGYASCFIGWAAMNIALVLTGDLLDRDHPGPGDPAAPRHRPGRRRRRTRPCPWPVCFRANLNGCTYFWGFIAVVATFFWVLFYVI